MILTSHARAHINWGRWIAACPDVNCNSAEELHPWPGYECSHRDCRVMDYPDSMFHCSNCNLISSIDWPADAEEIWRELQRRPNVHTRNWYPADHELAVKWNLPHGQSVADLAQEFAERS